MDITWRLSCALALCLSVARPARAQTPTLSGSAAHWHATTDIGLVVAPSLAFFGGMSVFHSGPHLEFPYASLDAVYAGDGVIPITGLGLNVGDRWWTVGGSAVYIGGATSSHVTFAPRAMVRAFSALRLEIQAFPWHTDDRFVIVEVGLPFWGFV